MHIFSLLFAGLAVGACSCGSQASGVPLTSQDDLFPKEMKSGEQTLKLGGQAIQATAKVITNGTERRIQLFSDGTMIDEEIYEVDDSGIRLVSLPPGEKFVKPIPLISYGKPLRSTWNWEGQKRLGTRSLKATAKISTDSVKVAFQSGSNEAVLVTVELKVEDGSPKPYERKLMFWFVRGEGLLKRDFTMQEREPRVPGMEEETPAPDKK